ncbi:MAG: type VI secretion system lipoprotein TssJ [Betaproteobacteria bacterium]|nr:type VI secretion system lipoprotein TssJ [Betaproteobacteria bacterium]
MLHSFRAFSLLSAILSLLCMAACSSTPKPPPPTVLQITFQATATVNPDSRGRPSPVVVRLFELKSLAAFEAADFFSLYERDKETLGSELLAREEIQLHPSEQLRVDRQTQSETRYVAVIAAFRGLERAVWRGSVAVSEHKTTPLMIRTDSNKISISSK